MGPFLFLLFCSFGSMFSIDGIVSGFDTSGIIDSLLGFQQTQIDTFNLRRADIATEQTAFAGIEAQLLTLQSSIRTLNRPQASVFDVRSAVSSNEDVLSVVADGGATSGSFQLTVNQLATTHQVGSQGFSTSSDQIASGEITFQVGDRTAQTIAIDQGNNTLSGFVDTVNDQVEDVNASIVFDQGSDSFRVLLTSTETGQENTIAVTSNLTGEGATPDFSGPAVQEATNAVITLGSGPGAITAQYSSNTIDQLIEDVTIELRDVSDTPITIDVTADTEPAIEAIESFVAEFNALIDFIDTQTEFLPETDQAGPLLGNRSVSSIKNNLLSTVTETITNTGSVSRLSQIGVSLNSVGNLVINSEQLSQAVNGELEGVDPADIRNLFGLNASSNNSGIEFLAGGERTQGGTSPYQVDITQAAEQASVTATTAVNETTTIDDTNNTIQITLDGIVSDELTLESGQYTREEIASAVETLINQSAALGNHNVGVGLNASNQLTVTSEAFGSDSRVASISGSLASTIGFDGTESDDGQDVEGVFIVDGVEEIANGSGRLLIGDPDNENTADLQLRVTLTANQLTSGAEGAVSVSRGITGNVNTYIDSVLNSESGILRTVEEEFETRIASIDQSIQRVEDITESRREFLVAEFTALESIISELQTTGSFITSQLASIGPLNSSDN